VDLLPDADGYLIADAVCLAEARAITSVTYDTAGRRDSLTDSVDNTTVWAYDALGRMVEEKNALDDARTFVYDAVGQLIEKTDRNQRVTQFDYDDLGRRTEERWLDSQQQTVRTIEFDYDLMGRIEDVTDDGDAADYTFVYDNLGRVTSVTHDIDGLTPDVVLSAKYDLAGQRKELAASIGGTDDFLTTYEYDDLGRIDSIAQEAKDVQYGNAVAEKYVDFAFDLLGRPDKIERYFDVDHDPTDLVAQSGYTFDNAGRLTDLIHQDNAQTPTIFADYDWTHDLAGRITQQDFTSQKGTSGTTDYTYDASDQLIAGDHDYQTDESYLYDPNGNQVGNGYTVGPDNQLTSDGTYDYAYDDEGNRIRRTHSTTDATTRYEWDHRNRLVRVTEHADSNPATQPSQIFEYTYDYANRWLRKTVDANADDTPEEAVIFVHDASPTGRAALLDPNRHPGQIVLQFDGSGSVDLTAADISHRYLWGNAVDQILADEQVVSPSTSGTMLWPLTDHLNTVRDLLDSNGTVREHRVYASFGELTEETEYDAGGTLLVGTGTIEHLPGFTARFHDVHSGLNNHGQRWYDSLVHTWIIPDPIGFKGGDPNLYRYVNNEPIRETDPWGLRGRSTGGDFESDWAGRTILRWWLTGGGATRNIRDDDVKWTRYMKSWKVLRQEVRLRMQGEAMRLANVEAYKNGAFVNFDLSLKMNPSPGESITGYNYLGGTNPDLSIRGWAAICHPNKKAGTPCATVTFRNVLFTWNDKINAEPDRYASDARKALAGEIITFGYAQDYDIHISWKETTSSVSFDRHGMISSESGWPMVPLPKPKPPSREIPQCYLDGTVPYKVGMACFGAGTPVLTPDGHRPIESLAKGDIVLAFDPASESIVRVPVLQLDIHHGNFDLLEVEICGGESVHVTEDHPFFVGSDWMPSRDLDGLRHVSIAMDRFATFSVTQKCHHSNTAVYNVRTRLGTYLVGRVGLVVSGRVFDSRQVVSDISAQRPSGGKEQGSPEFASGPTATHTWRTR